MGAAFQIESHENREERHNHLSWTDGPPFFGIALDAVGPLGCVITLLTHVQFFSCQ